METFLIKYGLLSVLIGAMIEADVIPVLAGVVAHLGYFPFFAVIGAGTVGAFIGDCVWFFVGRNRSARFRQRPAFSRASKWSESLDERLGKLLIPASHVIYGTRIATMTLSGIRQMPFIQFAVIDALGCLTFTTLFVTLGYLFSSSASLLIGNLKRVEVFLLVAVIVVCLGVQLLRVLLNWVSASKNDVKRA